MNKKIVVKYFVLAGLASMVVLWSENHAKINRFLGFDQIEIEVVFVGRIFLVVISLAIAVLLFVLSSLGKRKLAKIWILASCAWALSCITLVLYPFPPPDISDISQWQGVWLMLEVVTRGVVGLFSLVILGIYLMSPKGGHIRNE